jgi:hypothetical protein
LMAPPKGDVAVDCRKGRLGSAAVPLAGDAAHDGDAGRGRDRRIPRVQVDTALTIGGDSARAAGCSRRVQNLCRARSEIATDKPGFAFVRVAFEALAQAV